MTRQAIRVSFLLRTVGLLLTLLAMVVGRSAFAGQDERPNLILILVDDLRWNSLSFLGDPVVKTPNIDRLAERGVTFRNAFVTTSICAVSRASIFTGQYARRHGINDFATPFGDEALAQTYPAILRANGYRTGFIGKYGVGRDVSVMADDFDYWKGLPGQAGPFFEKNDPTKTHATSKFGSQALEFFGQGPREQPFCLSLSFSAPHARDGQPREYPPDLRDEPLYVDDVIPVPSLATEEAWLRLPEYARNLEGRRRWARRFSTPEMFQRIVKDYDRLIAGLDREVGRIVEELEKLGVAEKTVIVFLSDNGYILGERGMADKWLPFEESIRVPLIVMDPRTPTKTRGTSVDALALNIDVAPTFLEMAGLEPPARMQGRSLVPFLEGEPRPADWRTEFFYEHLTFPDIIPATEGVRDEGWMYFRWLAPEPDLEELYDLAADPLQEHNLAAEPEHVDRLKRMRTRWEALREELK